MNVWTGIAIGAVALAIFGLGKLAKTGANLVTEIKGRIHSLDFSQITFAIDALIKNPSQNGLTIQYPFIKILYKGSLIASSQLVNQVIDIAPLSQTTIKSIKIPVSYFNLTGVGAELIQKLQNKKNNMTLQVEISTIVHTGVSKLPFTTTQEITF